MTLITDPSPSKELAVIQERDPRPWYLRAWDTIGLPEWEAGVVFSLQSRSVQSLLTLIAQLEILEPAMAEPAPAVNRSVRTFYFDPEVLVPKTRMELPGLL